MGAYEEHGLLDKIADKTETTAPNCKSPLNALRRNGEIISTATNSFSEKQHYAYRMLEGILNSKHCNINEN